MVSKQQHTLGHLECPACQEARRVILEGQKLSELLFPEAARMWLDGRRKINDGTRTSYLQYIKSLTTFFGQLRLRDIDIGHVAEYQKARQAEIRAHRKIAADQCRDTDGSSRINHELSALGQIMARAGLWTEIQKFYEPLPLPAEGPGIALTEEEEEHLFLVARSRPKWFVAYCCGLLSRSTAAGPKEIRYLRLRDIDLEGERMSVEQGIKNKYRRRRLHLNEDAWWAVNALLERAQSLGAKDPDHFLLPHRAHRRGEAADPTRPMGSWKKAHYAMRREAGNKFPRLLHMRFYDYRHTAGTVMLENPNISYRTIETQMGHRLGSKVKECYAHIRDATLRAAAEALNGGHTRAPAPVPVRRPPVSGRVSWRDKTLAREPA